MPSFRRGRNEPASAWAARLGRQDASVLTPRQLDDLTLNAILAARAVKRESQAPVRREQEGEDARDSEGLRRCKEAVRSLPPEDRRRLARWIEEGLAD